MVVYGHDGLDELTLTTTSTVLELRDGKVRTYVVDPVALGLEPVDGAALRGDDAVTNADHARRVLEGERGPHREFALLNAAAGIVAAGRAEDLVDGLAAATAAVDDGRAAEVLVRLAEVSQREAARA